jgi:hypothetical protein
VALPGGAEINILEAIKLLTLHSELVEMKTEVAATIEVRIREVSDTLKAYLTILRNETVSAITSFKTTTELHTMTIAALETSTTSVSDLTTNLEADVKRLTADLKKVQESCVSLEGFSPGSNPETGISPRVSGNASRHGFRLRAAERGSPPWMRSP